MPFRASYTRTTYTPTRRSPRPPVPRHDGFSPAQQRTFLTTLAATASVTRAAAAAGVSRTTAYNHRHDPRAVDFREGWDEAVARAMAVLVDVALGRAVDGVEQPVFGVDGQIGTRTVYSDAMLRYLIDIRHVFAPYRTEHHADGRVTSEPKRTLAGFEKRLDRIDPAGSRRKRQATLSTSSTSHAGEAPGAALLAPSTAPAGDGREAP
jgi:hypothetical protein